MSTPQESNVAVSFFNIHKIITRGLQVSLESVQGILQRGFQDAGDPEGIFNYVQALVSVINSHHLTEDEIAFPYFRDMLSGAPYDLLMKQHQEMVGMLAEVKLAVSKCARDDELEAGLRDLEDALTRLNDLWHPHIQMEAGEIISKADALIPVEEQLRLVRLFGEHGQKYALPPYLTVPFMLYNLTEDDRKVFSQGMPAEVLQNLVPVVWKRQWESMTPYLLA